MKDRVKGYKTRLNTTKYFLNSIDKSRDLCYTIINGSRAVGFLRLRYKGLGEFGHDGTNTKGAQGHQPTSQEPRKEATRSVAADPHVLAAHCNDYPLQVCAHCRRYACVQEIQRQEGHLGQPVA